KTYPNAKGDGYYLYTDQWNRFVTQDNSRAVFQPNASNPSYYYVGDDSTQGKTYLYTLDAGGMGYTLATTYTPGIDYYTATTYFDRNAVATGYIATTYVAIDQSTTPLSGTDAQPYIAYGTPRPAQTTLDKRANPTGTFTYAVNAAPVTLAHGAQQFLGNNGRFEVLLTSVEVQKTWEPAPLAEEVWIGLLHYDGGFIPVPAPHDAPPLRLDASNAWRGSFEGLLRYALRPVGDALPLVQYTVLEGGFDGTAFTSWGTEGKGSQGDFSIGILQPQWDEANGTWSLARVTNTSTTTTYGFDPRPPSKIPSVGDGAAGARTAVAALVALVALGCVCLVPIRCAKPPRDPCARRQTKG
ncbi:MAG: hypothetical protein LBG81_01240, partial [Coriobacteriaceae bacterium]|nr:hypothetical protein [Coriobacteriaceae bacterium]